MHVPGRQKHLKYSHGTLLFAYLWRRRLKQCTSRFFSKIIMTKLMVHFYKTYTDEKQIENSNKQLNIKIITLSVLKVQISQFPLTLPLTSPKKWILICLCV